jgi:hypothetical protein
VESRIQKLREKKAVELATKSETQPEVKPVEPESEVEEKPVKKGEGIFG